MPDPVEACSVDPQQLPAPGRTVGTQPGAVERQAEMGTLEPVLDQDGRDVRVVVLHRYARDAQAPRVVGGEEIRVQIVGHGDRLDVEDGLEVQDALLEEPVRLGAVHVAEVLRQVRASAARQAHGVLQVGAGREDARNFSRQIDAVGDEAAAAPDDQRHPCDDPDDRVIAADDDGAVVPDDRVSRCR